MSAIQQNYGSTTDNGRDMPEFFLDILKFLEN
jgi:hypothetical protein